MNAQSLRKPYSISAVCVHNLNGQNAQSGSAYSFTRKVVLLNEDIFEKNNNRVSKSETLLLLKIVLKQLSSPII